MFFEIAFVASNSGSLMRVLCGLCLLTESAPPSGTNSAKQSPSAQHRAMGQQPPSYPDRYADIHAYERRQSTGDESNTGSAASKP